MQTCANTPNKNQPHLNPSHPNICHEVLVPRFARSDPTGVRSFVAMDENGTLERLQEIVRAVKAESRSRGVIAIPFGVTESTGSNNCDGSLPKIGEETSINQLFFVMGTVSGPMGNMGNSETCRGQRTFGAMPHQFCSSVGTRGPLSGIGHTSARRKKGIFLLLSLW